MTRGRDYSSNARKAALNTGISYNTNTFSQYTANGAHHHNHHELTSDYSQAYHEEHMRELVANPIAVRVFTHMA